MKRRRRGIRDIAFGVAVRGQRHDRRHLCIACGDTAAAGRATCSECLERFLDDGGTVTRVVNTATEIRLGPARRVEALTASWFGRHEAHARQRIIPRVTRIPL